MERMSGDELRNGLIAKNLIDDAGTVNAITVNCISGVHTWPLLSEVWDLYLHDIDAMANLQTFLNELYENNQHEIMVGVLKICYNFCSLLIPDDVQMIFNCKERELKDTYFYEFLEDFQDIMYGFQAKKVFY
jgi:hypothetical protein